MNLKNSVLVLVAASSIASVACVREQAVPPAAKGDVITIGLISNTTNGLPKCTSALAGTTAYVQSPASLWSCQAGSWIPIPCVGIGAGAVAYSSATQTLLACVSGQWTVVPLPQGPQGDAGPQGRQGDPGAQGDAGAPGSLLKLSDAGASCPNGGQRIDVGRDKNGNGTLDDGEIEQTAYICNGKDGANGAGGQSSAAGTGGQSDAGIDAADPLECVTTWLQTRLAAGSLDHNVSADCAGQIRTCCPGSVACDACGPLRFDLVPQPGDDPRLVITPVRYGQDRVVVRARVKTMVPIPIRIPVIGVCDVLVDTEKGSQKDVELGFTLTGSIPDGGAPIVSAGSVEVSRLTSDDVTVTGGLGCALADDILSLAFTFVGKAFLDAIHGDVACFPESSTADGGAGDAVDGNADAGVSNPHDCDHRCGVLRNACGVEVDCGTSQCSGAETCGGGGTANVCG